MLFSNGLYKTIDKQNETIIKNLHKCQKSVKKTNEVDIIKSTNLYFDIHLFFHDLTGSTQF